jgi:hypothetical protein
MNCEYCNSEFKTKSALNNHKNKAKYCLVLQGKIERKEEELFKCNLCNKLLSTKQKLELHKQKCEGEKEKIEEEFKCEYCDKILSTKRNLEIHMKKCEIIEEKEEFKCKYCEKILSSKQNLEIHIKKCEIIVEKEEYKCEYCHKFLSTKQKLDYHNNICDKKKEKEQKEYKEKLQKEIKELKEQLESKDKELKEKDKLLIKIKTQNENYQKQEENYKEQIQKQKEEYKEQLEKQEEKYEEQIKDLLDKLENLATKAIERPTTIVSNTTTNNNLNIATSMDFDNIDHIKNLIDNSLTINHVVDGQKGLANFVRETMLLDDNGISKYVCTDPSRHIFKYKDTNGEIKKDVEAKKLTSSLVKGGIRKQTAIIGNDWLESQENSNDYLHKLELMMEFQQNIHKIGDNNTDFRKELALLTS